MLYYATIILLHRPFYSTPAHHAACRRASDNLEKFLLLLEKTFGFTRSTYLMAYCIYTGASALVQDVKLGDVEAARKIQTYIRALRQGVTTCPLEQRSLAIITGSLRAEPAQRPPPSSYVPSGAGGRRLSEDDDDDDEGIGDEEEAGGQRVVDATAGSAGGDAAGRNYLPAFPYRDMQLGAGGPYGTEAAQLGNMDLDGVSLLDCFPENHLDHVTGEWYMP